MRATEGNSHSEQRVGRDELGHLMKETMGGTHVLSNAEGC